MIGYESPSIKLTMVAWAAAEERENYEECYNNPSGRFLLVRWGRCAFIPMTATKKDRIISWS